MDRKDFIKKGLLGTTFYIAGSSKANNLLNNSDEIEALDPQKIHGFNHIPNTKSKVMPNIIIHKEETRGAADHGWLKAKHSFSFANYYNPERMHFGALRVLNDDFIEGGMGFGTHPHDNMEIITIPLEGAIEHKDSMGNSSVIQTGEIQVMSAGTGIQHSEYNHIKDKPLKLLQIWILPNKNSVTPRYDQLVLNPTDKVNKLQQILSPNPDDEGVWIHQNSWFHLGKFEKDKSITYRLKDTKNGVYAFIINGDFTILGHSLNRRDAIGLWELEEVSIVSNSNDSEILLIEVPVII